MGARDNPSSGQRGSALLPGRRWLLLAAILLLSAVAVYQGWHQHLSLERLAANEQSLRDVVAARPVTAIAGYAAIYAAAVALSLPGALVLTLAGGFLFGWLIGGLVAVAAATAGASAIFLVARSTLGAWFAARAGSRMESLAQGFRRDALSYLLFLRLVPAFPFWLVNLAPALLGVRLSTFVLATFLGIIPGTFAFALAGSGLDRVIAAQRQAYDSCLARAAAPETCGFTLEPTALLTPGIIAPLVALGLLALVPIGARKLMARRGFTEDR